MCEEDPFDATQSQNSTWSKNSRMTLVKITQVSLAPQVSNLSLVFYGSVLTLCLRLYKVLMVVTLLLIKI